MFEKKVSDFEKVCQCRRSLVPYVDSLASHVSSAPNPRVSVEDRKLSLEFHYKVDLC